MEQNITIRIGGNEYNLKAKSQEDEEVIRKAADSIGKKINAYNNKFPGRDMIDILSFVALNESINSINLKKALDSFNEEAESLLKDSTSYLDKI